MCGAAIEVDVGRLLYPQHRFDSSLAESGRVVEFRLVYRGRLHAEAKRDNRSREKHELRKQFHRQLAVLWHEHPYLLKAFEGGKLQNDDRSEVERIADNYTRCGGRFVPIINARWGLGCALDVLFLRRDEPGGVITHGGDLDNRLKVLSDGLRMPNTIEELGGMPIEPDENPFFCLLEDDKLITEINITSDKLLLPRETDEHIHDVLLIIKAKTVMLDDGPFPVARLGW
jgi:hypothetical protein